jgi:hypothetical protein
MSNCIGFCPFGCRKSSDFTSTVGMGLIGAAVVPCNQLSGLTWTTPSFQHAVKDCTNLSFSDRQKHPGCYWDVKRI